VLGNPVADDLQVGLGFVGEPDDHCPGRAMLRYLLSSRGKQ
jgi:hypothetical protein